MFIDSNLTTRLTTKMDLTTGVNLLVGRADADSLRYGQRLLLDGVSEVPSTESVNPKGTVDFNDRRRFVGLYAQSHYRADVQRRVCSAGCAGTPRMKPATRLASTAEGSERSRRPRKMSIGSPARWARHGESGRTRTSPISVVTLHGSVGYTFQPAQIEFGPESRGPARGRRPAQARDPAQRHRGTEGRYVRRHRRVRHRRLLRRLLQPAGSGHVRRRRRAAIDRPPTLQGHRRRGRAAAGEEPDGQGQYRLERCAATATI